MSTRRTVLQCWRSRVPSALAVFAASLGFGALVDAAMPRERGHVHAISQVIPVPATAAATAVVAVSGLILLRIAAGLRRRKRRAWQVAVVASSVTVVADVLKAHRIGDAAIAGVLLVSLIVSRDRFRAKDDPASRRLALRVAVQFLLVAFAFGLAMLYLNPRHVVGRLSFGGGLAEVGAGLLGFGGPVALRGDLFSDIWHGTVLGFGLSTLAVVVLLLLRPPEPVARLSVVDEHRLRDLLARHGARDSLGYFALRRDKSVIWSASGKAAITYRVVRGVALASGDPLGDPEAWPGAMAVYRDLVRQHGWSAAVIGCSELGATIYERELGLRALALGDEAVVYVDEFTLDGRAMRGVRQSCAKAGRAGYTARVRRVRDIPASELDELLRVTVAWREAAVERGFSMALSRIGDAHDGDCVVVSAYQEGVLRGMLHFVPWGADGLSLDVMRRDRSAENGLNEYMIASLMSSARSLGVRRASLNFAVFRDALERGGRLGAGPVLRSWRAVLIFLSRWWQIESLYRFNARFRPVWDTRFVLFSATRDLPRIAIAALDAEAFLVRPHPVKRLIGRGAPARKPASPLRRR